MNVFLIDDDKDFRESMAIDFKNKGITPYCFEHPNECLESKEIIPNYIILDLRLKNDLGLDYIDDLKTKYPKAFLVLLTAYGSIRTTVEAIKKGADEYILKPCRFSDLFALLNNKTFETQNCQNDMLDLYQKEKEYIDFVLMQNQGNISKSAEVLGIRRQSLQRKLKKMTEKKNE